MEKLSLHYLKAHGERRKDDLELPFEVVVVCAS